MNNNESSAIGEVALGDLPARIPAEGTYNVRDLGVYTSRTGRPLRRGVYYRADNLGMLTPKGGEQLLELGLRAVIDLRTAQEMRVRPNRFGERPEIRYYPVDLVGDSHEIISRGDTIVSNQMEERSEKGFFADPAGRLITIYSTMLDHQGAAFRRAISLLAQPDASPALFHCVAGQDRTGLIAAFLLSVADVSEETIVFDYAATAQYNVRRYLDEKGEAIWGMPIETAAEYGSQFCPPEAMEGTLAHLRHRHGGAVRYLETIGITSRELETIREKLLS
ncbi:MAG: tyrosine-protein phosphatase [Spirochaetaceae bacterium]